jgi:hypothetical protein
VYHPTACCHFSQQRQMAFHRIARAAAISLTGYLLTASVLVSLYLIHLINKTAVSWTLLGCLIAVLIAYFELSRVSRPALAWRRFESSDLFQMLSFPLFYAISWHDVLKDSLQGWGLSASVTVATAATSLIAWEFILRIPSRITHLRAMIFDSLTPIVRRYEYESRRHELFCIAGDDDEKKNSIRRKAYLAAGRRKAIRTPGTLPHILFRLLDKFILIPFGNITLWLASYTISAATFPLLVQHVTPGPLAALLLFAPFILIPPVDLTWQKIKQMHPDRAELTAAND